MPSLERWLMGTPLVTRHQTRGEGILRVSRRSADRAARDHQESAKGASGRPDARPAKIEGDAIVARKNPHIGSNFESWLDEEGIREDVTAAAIKAVIARQLANEMKKKNHQAAHGRTDEDKPSAGRSFARSRQRQRHDREPATRRPYRRPRVENAVGVIALRAFNVDHHPEVGDRKLLTNKKLRSVPRGTLTCHGRTCSGHPRLCWLGA